MDRLNSADELERVRKSIVENRDPGKPCLTICGGTGCHALGAGKVVTALQQERKQQGIENKVDIRTTGCHGFCERGPLVVIKPANIFYQRMSAEDVPEVISETVVKGNVIDRLLYTDPNTGKKITYENEVPFYKGQNVPGTMVSCCTRKDCHSLEGYRMRLDGEYEIRPPYLAANSRFAPLRGIAWRRRSVRFLQRAQQSS